MGLEKPYLMGVERVPDKRQELLKELYDAVVKFDSEKVIKLCEAALQSGVNASDALENALVPAMEYVGKLYDEKEYFVPELLLCAEAFYAGLNTLKPHIKVKETEITGKIVLGTVQGDIHDIGKNLLKMMFEAARWTVYDLGRDVPHEEFVKKVIETDSDVVGMSALMSTSMLGMPKLIRLLRQSCPNVIILVGGAPLNLEVAKKFGADGYARNAAVAVQVATELLKRKRGLKA